MYMYMWRGTPERPTNGEIVTVSAGYMTVDDIDATVDRDEGRQDYQFIYVKSGCAIFTFDKEEITLTAGNALFYHPAEAQHYKYFKKDKTHVCWIHFGGSRIPDLLNKLGLDNVRTLQINNGSIIEEKIHGIVDEMDLQKDFYEEETNSKLISLLIAVARNEKQRHQDQYEELIHMICEKIRQNYTTDFTNAEYAAECDMSISYFLRIFKRVTGTSPHNYQIKQRLMAAKGMLINTDYSILEISKLVGFEDSMYFSRCFKKYEGISPKAYKNKMKNVL